MQSAAFAWRHKWLGRLSLVIDFESSLGAWCHTLREAAHHMCCCTLTQCHGLCHAMLCAIPTCSIISSTLSGTVAPAQASCSLSLQALSPAAGILQATVVSHSVQ